MLDPNSSDDLCALRYVFLPRCEHSFDSFVTSYSHRYLRSESNRTQNQLWIQVQSLDPKYIQEFPLNTPYGKGLCNLLMESSRF